MHPGPDDRARRPPSLRRPGEGLIHAPVAVAGEVARGVDPPHEVLLPRALVREAVMALHVLRVPFPRLAQRVLRVDAFSPCLCRFLLIWQTTAWRACLRETWRGPAWAHLHFPALAVATPTSATDAVTSISTESSKRGGDRGPPCQTSFGSLSPCRRTQRFSVGPAGPPCGGESVLPHLPLCRLRG